MSSILNVETIEFLGVDASALPLTIGRTTRVAPPEWVRGTQPLPVAYAKPGNHVTIKATFSCSDLSIQSAKVRAVSQAPHSRSMGAVAEKTVQFNGAGRSQAVQFQVAIKNDAIDLDQATWQWQFKTGKSWVDANTSTHEIAIALADPKSPWTRDTGATNGDTVVWWEVLSEACRIASGVTGPERAEKALTKITKNAYQGWGDNLYEYSGEAEAYASNPGTNPSSFDCATFLRLLQKDPDVPRIVDCSDMAAIVSTFGASLGCDVRQLVLHLNIRCHPIKLVGTTDWRFGFESGMHEIAFSGTLTGSNQEIWDACLELSGDRSIDPDDPPTRVLMPTDLSPAKYLKQFLLGPPSTLQDHYYADPSVRPIRTVSSEIMPVVFDDLLKQTATSNQFETWQDPTGAQKQISPIEWTALHIDGWSLVEAQQGVHVAPPGVNTKLTRTLWRANADPKPLIVVDTYVCVTAVEARRRMLVVLSRISGARLDRVQRPPLSGNNREVGFASADGLAFLGSRWNTVVFVRRAGPSQDGVKELISGYFNLFDRAMDRLAAV